ncbi:hypothetical protein, partial [Klebsiella pneumoniae]|uniref:hypothetical protein n=1 Tax=Klebsiella pneumoniae TaxID=573 RepID=UPI003CCB5FAF
RCVKETGLGRILEIKGRRDLKVGRAFKLPNASGGLSPAGCPTKLKKEPIFEYRTPNVFLLKGMTAEG